MMDDLAGAHASGTFLKPRKFIFYFGRNQLYCISFCKQAFRGDIPGVFIFRADFRADVIHFIFILLLNTHTRCSPSGSWTNPILDTRRQDRAVIASTGALLVQALLHPLHPSPPGINSLLDSLNNIQPRHVLETCPAVEETRIAVGIRSFLDDCLKAGRSRASAYRHYVMGLDKFGDRVNTATHLKRGESLHLLTEEWLKTWEDVEESQSAV